MPAPTGRSFESEAIRIFTIRIFTPPTAGTSGIRAVGDRRGLFLWLGRDWPQAA
ncbi:hypothetical protein ABZV31_06455 [Streptomyces sp. NPDC005202]|uniref:hypothetical protein n=1 Tax=Streptomyces sp. NPDC005202 TaxID=3157021 RepID=UPI0033A7F9CD